MIEDSSFQSHYIAYHNELFRFLYSYMQCPDQARSLLQDLFLKLFEHRASIPESQVKPWLYKTGHHLALNALRSQKRRDNWHERARQHEALPMNYEAIANPEQQMLDSEREQARARQKALVQRAQEALPTRQALLLQLRYSGLNYEEIANVLEVQPNSISQLLFRAKKAFRRAYEEICAEDGITPERSAP